MTRQEATGIPNLLVAPRTPPSRTGRDVYENGVGDFRGYYEDGAYIARQHDAEAVKEESEDQQSAYFDSILTRYEALREQLKQTPPRQAVERLDLDHPTRVERMNKTLSQWWIRKLKSVDPRSAQIACFDKGSVLRLLRLMTQGTLLKRTLGAEATLSRWVWSLLAKLPERGELSSEEIGVVRELGKKAVLVAVGLRDQKEWEDGIREAGGAVDGDEEEEGEIGVDVVNEEEIVLDLPDDEEEARKEPSTDEHSGIGTYAHAHHAGDLSPHEAELTTQSMAATMQEEANNTTDSVENLDPLSGAKARILARLNEHADTENEFPTNQMPMDGPVQPVEIAAKADAPVFDAKSNAKAAVDMILTVAGEVYGQRDLLEFRGGWDHTA